MLNLNLNWVSETIKTLAQWWPIVKSNFQAIQDNFNKHVTGTADKHSAQHITYSGKVTGATNVKEGLDKLRDRIEQIITTPVEDISAQEIIDARGEETSLGGRIDKIDARFTDIMINIKHPPAPLVGAKCDGITDDTDAIQAIINSLSNGGKIIIPGKCKITTINLKSNIFIEGIGQETSGFISSSDVIINVPNLSVRWGLSNFGVWGDPASSTAINMAGSSGGIADFSIRDLYIKSCKIGANSYYAWGFSYDRVRFQDCETALMLNSQTNQGVFNACSFKVSKQVARFSNASSINFIGCEFAGNEHDGTIPFSFYASNSISFEGNYIETFAGNTPLMEIGTLNSICRAICFKNNLCAYNTSENLFTLYNVDGVEITNNRIYGVSYLITTKGDCKNLKIENNANFIDEIPSENVIPNYNFFAWGNGINTLPNNFTNVGSDAFFSRADDGSLQIVATANLQGIYTFLNLKNVDYISQEIGVKSDVNNALYIDAIIDGIYQVIGSESFTAGEYQKIKLIKYVNASSITAYRIRFSNSGIHNIKYIKVYAGIKNTDEDKNPRMLCNRPPTHGEFQKGQIIENINPAPGNYLGWICTENGTPGTWKGFGLIET